MDPSYKRSKVKDMAHAHMHDHHAHMVPVATQVMLAIVTTLVLDDGLKQEMRQVVDLMKNLSLNLLSNARNAQGHGRQANQFNGDNGQGKTGNGLNNGRGWRKVPTCYNCGELGHISPQCDKPSRMGGDMYPLPT